MYHRIVNEGMTINAVIIKKTPQSPWSQSTNAPEDEARVVLPAVPIDANKAYWVAVYVLSNSYIWLTKTYFFIKYDRHSSQKSFTNFK